MYGEEQETAEDGRVEDKMKKVRKYNRVIIAVNT